MRHVTPVLCLVGLVAVAVAAGQPEPASGSRPATVGRFLAAWAERVGVELPAGPLDDGSLAVLQDRRMIAADVDPARILTEGDLVRLLATAGVRVQAPEAGRPVSAARVEQFFATFHELFDARARPHLRFVPPPR
ncbi:MAG: hypothetical protein ACE5IK_11360 [Acidobacteriota bacterium]